MVTVGSSAGLDCGQACHGRIWAMRKRVVIIVLAALAVLGLVAGMLGGTPT
ncbi:hypothetical protein ACU4IU_13070 [Brevibacterium sp. CSND-B09]|uniref:hypothetical protein n=1 Tax=Brevibacterium sp. CSND-B09 TaxID=3462571 RepID=UPI00406A5617